MDVCILAFGIMISVLLAGVILSRRHGYVSALAPLVGALLLSLATALSGYLMLGKSLETRPDSSDGWHKITTPGGRAIEIRYKPEAGLLVTTKDGETSTLRDVPFCLADGQLARLTPNYVETADDPYVALPRPPRPFKHQISFNLSYAISTAGLGASSFGIDENGELWCTESLYQANTGGTGSNTLALSYIAIFIFTGSFVVTVVLTAIALEIRRRCKTPRRT